MKKEVIIPRYDHNRIELQCPVDYVWRSLSACYKSCPKGIRCQDHFSLLMRIWNDERLDFRRPGHYEKWWHNYQWAYEKEQDEAEAWAEADAARAFHDPRLADLF